MIRSVRAAWSRQRGAWTLCAVLLVPAPALAATITVPDDFATIRAALDSDAIDTADTLLVRAGVVTDTLVALNLNGGLIIVGEGDSLSRPSIGPMTGNTRSGGIVTFVNFRFTGLFHTVAKANFVFRDCRFDAGLTTIIDGDPRSMRLVRCRFTGLLRAHTDVGVAIDSCWFDHGSVELTGDGFLQVYVTAFTGSGGLTAIYANGEIVADINGNTIRDYGAGIVLGGTGPRHIQGNVVDQCGTGISVGGIVQVLDNVVTDCGGDGIAVFQEDGDAHVERNVVARSGVHGIRVVNSYGPVTVRNNTSVGNAASGFALSLPAELGPGDVSNNIAYDNRHYGLLCTGPVDPVLSCNDWFANDSGAVAGMAPSPTDLEVDPGFCDVEADSLTLHADSPLANAPGCGLVGARGVGCMLTAVLVERFEARELHDRIALRWRFGPADPPDEHWIERSEGSAGAWVALGAGATESETYILDDRNVIPGRAYEYRLAWREDDLTAYGGTVAVTFAGVPLEFRLAPVVPNPSSGAVVVRWSQPRERWVDLRVYDLSGREVATIARGRYEAGEHAAPWEGRTARGRVASGLYFLRAHGEDTRSRSFLVVR